MWSLFASFEMGMIQVLQYFPPEYQIRTMLSFFNTLVSNPQMVLDFLKLPSFFFWLFTCRNALFLNQKVQIEKDQSFISDNSEKPQQVKEDIYNSKYREEKWKQAFEVILVAFTHQDNYNSDELFLTIFVTLFFGKGNFHDIFQELIDTVTTKFLKINEKLMVNILRYLLFVSSEEDNLSNNTAEINHLTELSSKFLLFNHDHFTFPRLTRIRNIFINSNKENKENNDITNSHSSNSNNNDLTNNNNNSKLNPECKKEWIDISYAVQTVIWILGHDSSFLSKYVHFYHYDEMNEDSLTYADISVFLIHLISTVNLQIAWQLIEPLFDIFKTNVSAFKSKIILDYSPILLTSFPSKSQDLLSLLSSLNISINIDQINSTPSSQANSQSAQNIFENTRLQSMTNRLEASLKIYTISFNKYAFQLIDDFASSFTSLFETKKEIEDKHDKLHLDFVSFQEEARNHLDFHNRRSSRVYYSIRKKLTSVNGGAWSKNSDLPHYKFANWIDSEGRKLFMVRKKRFRDYTIAAKIRDQGNYSALKSIEPHVIDKSWKIFDFYKDESFSDVQEIDQNSTDNLTNININTIVKLQSQMITITKYYKGTITIIGSEMSFDASEITDCYGKYLEKTTKSIDISLNSLVLVLKRNFLHEDTGCELFAEKGLSYFFLLESASDRNQLFRTISKYSNCIIQFKDALKVYHDLGLKKKWQNGEISNYEYIYWINMLSGRSFQDLSQYPIFPWVIKDYESETIDLNDQNTYRDLSKPLGALNPQRLENLKSNYDEQDEMACLYRFMYSTPAYVINFLIRCEPFTNLHVQLQDGHFDIADRIFYSIPKTWKSITSKESDYRELIPEFFSTPEFLINGEKIDLGIRKATQQRVDNVDLPKWANSAAAFIAINRIALESNYVSERLNNWIDLIFGLLQRSYEANNIYHPFSYPDAFQAVDPSYTEVIKNHAANFGIVPNQLFTNPHSPRLFKVPKNLITLRQNLFFKFLISEKVSILKMTYSPGRIHILTQNSITIYYITSNLNSNSSNISSQKITNSGSYPDRLSRIFKRKVDSSLVPEEPPPIIHPNHNSMNNININNNDSSIQSDALISKENTTDNENSITISENSSASDIEKNSISLSKTLNENIEMKEGKKILYDFGISGVALSKSIILKHTAITSKFILIASSYSGDVSIFQDTRKAEPIKISAHTSPITCVDSDSYGYVVTASSDSSIIIWDLSSTTFKREGITFVRAHTASVAGIAIDSKMGLLCSCDINGIIVLSSVPDGLFLRSFPVKSPPSYILLARLGFIVLIYDQSDGDTLQSSVEIRDLAGRFLKEKCINNLVSAAILIQFKNYESYIVLATETNQLWILRTYDLEVMTVNPLPGFVESLSFSPDDGFLYILTNTNKVYVSNLFMK